MTDIARQAFWTAEGVDLEYDSVLGTYCSAPAHSNRDDGFFSGEKHYVNGVHCGYKWQCVEYARRYLLTRRALVFGDCGRASEIYHLLHTLKNVETGETINWERVANGQATTRPEAGAVIIYPYVPEKMPWGHVGVISFAHYFSSEELASLDAFYASLKAKPADTLSATEKSLLAYYKGRDGTGKLVGFVGIAEQNIHSKGWGDKVYGRTVAVIERAEYKAPAASEDRSPTKTSPKPQDGPFYTLEEHDPMVIDCLGWRPLPTSVPDRADFLQPIKSLPETREQEDKVGYFDLYPFKEAVDPGLLSIEEQSSKGLQLWRKSHPLRDQGVFKWETIASPQGGVGETCVGTTHKAVRTTFLGLEYLFQHFDDAKLSAEFSVPLWFAAAARESFNASKSTRSRDQLLARLDMSFNGKHRTTVQRLAYDSTDYFVDVGFQDRVAVESGHAAGFSPTGFTRSLRRTIPHLLANAEQRFGLPAGAAKTFHFIGLPSDLATDFDRSKALCVFEDAVTATKGWPEEGVPPASWTVKWVELDAVQVTSDGHLVDSDGTRIVCAFKSAPWRDILSRSAKDQPSGLLKLLLAPTLNVHQPAWTALVDTTHFVQLLRQWIASKALTKDLVVASELERNEIQSDAELAFLPEEGCDGFGPYIFSAAVLQQHAPADRKDVLSKLGLAESMSSNFFIASVFAVEGYFTATVCLESRTKTKEEAKAVVDASHCKYPACFRFIFPVKEEQQEEEKESASS